MTGLRIVDPHVHFWDLSRARYGWLQDDPLPNNPAGDMSSIAHRDYLPADYRRDAGAWRVEKVVHVECGQPRDGQLAETEWLEGLAATDPMVAGLVAGADLLDPDLERKLEAQAAQPHVRGVRQIVCWHAEPRKTYTDRDLLQDDAWWAGFGKLARFGLSFDLQLYPSQMAEAARRLAAAALTPVIANHAGLPTDRDPEGMQRWRDGLKALAALPQVAIKISGLGITHPATDAATLRPAVLACIEAFGTERAMFASDFPVDRVYASFDAIYAAFDAITRDFTPDERERLFAANAETIYRI